VPFLPLPLSVCACFPISPFSPFRCFSGSLSILFLFTLPFLLRSRPLCSLFSSPSLPVLKRNKNLHSLTALFPRGISLSLQMGILGSDSLGVGGYSSFSCGVVCNRGLMGTLVLGFDGVFPGLYFSYSSAFLSRPLAALFTTSILPAGLRQGRQQVAPFLFVLYLGLRCRAFPAQVVQ